MNVSLKDNKIAFFKIEINSFFFVMLPSNKIWSHFKLPHAMWLNIFFCAYFFIVSMSTVINSYALYYMNKK